MAIACFAAMMSGKGEPMRSQDFKKWRKSLDLSQKEAAEALGLKRRVVQYYEKGERGGKKVKIPKTVRLACYALSSGIRDYRGPDGNPLFDERPGKGEKAGEGRSAKEAEEGDEADGEAGKQEE